LIVNYFYSSYQNDTIPHTVDLMRKIITIPNIDIYIEKNGFSCICRDFDNNGFYKISHEWRYDGLRSIVIDYDHSNNNSDESKS
jgi:hypothetical protein